MGSGERAGKRASFNGAAAANGSGVIWGAHAPSRAPFGAIAERNRDEKCNLSVGTSIL